MKPTPLKAKHQALGGRLVPFAGWEMPVQYEGILAEARMVRGCAGLFDLCHMGRVRVTGKNAEAFLQRVQTNDASKVKPGAIRYSMFLDRQGLVQDDILVYRQADDEGFFLVINAANADRDLKLMHEAAVDFEDLQVVDQTEQLGMFAIQGPQSQEITQRLTDHDLSSLGYYKWTPARLGGVQLELSRTGYTGEDGFEVYADAERIGDLWDAFLDAGKPDGLKAAGLGSRDTLRLEAGMPLYGHEIDETTTPLDAGLDWAVKFTHDFTGRAALEKIQADGGPQRKLVGLKTSSKRVPRQGYPVLSPASGEAIGSILSGAASPTLQTNIATTYVPLDLASPGTDLEFEVRGKREVAQTCDLPFYKRSR